MRLSVLELVQNAESRLLSGEALGDIMASEDDL